MHAMTITEKETMNLKWNKEMNVGGFGGRTGNGVMVLKQYQKQTTERKYLN